MQGFIEIPYRDYKACEAYCYPRPTIWPTKSDRLSDGLWEKSSSYLREDKFDDALRTMERRCIFRHVEDQEFNATRAIEFLKHLSTTEKTAEAFGAIVESEMELLCVENNIESPPAFSGPQLVDSGNENTTQVGDDTVGNVTLGGRPLTIDGETDNLGPNPDYIKDYEDADKLDKSFMLREGLEMGKFFIRGRIFAMVWHENAGHRQPNSTDVTKPLDRPFHTFTVTRDKVRVFSHIRRFVVVKPKNGYCWAIPINSYSGNGLTSKNMIMQDKYAHCIIYSKGSQPRRLTGEPHLTKKPIVATMADGEPSLNNASRLNFGKMQSIEYNIRVKDVGLIDDAVGLKRLTSYFKQEILQAAF